MLNWSNLITQEYSREQQMLIFPFWTTFSIYKSPCILESLKGLTSVLLFSKSCSHITCHVKEPGGNVNTNHAAIFVSQQRNINLVVR